MAQKNAEVRQKVYSEFWQGVERTDPKHTKPVSYGGRKFTAIDPMYQLRTATEHWGPLGGNWWYTVDEKIIEGPNETQTVRMRVELFTPENQDHSVIAFGSCQLVAERVDAKTGAIGHRWDTDAWKKAQTDAFTKALSMLGFNADVFLGRYDDQKYVAEMRREFTDDGKAKDGGAAAREASRDAQEREERPEDATPQAPLKAGTRVLADAPVRAAAAPATKAATPAAAVGPLCATAAQVESILDLVGAVHGAESADYVVMILRKLKVQRVEDVPAARAVKWIAQLKTELDAKEGR